MGWNEQREKRPGAKRLGEEVVWGRNNSERKEPPEPEALEDLARSTMRILRILQAVQWGSWGSCKEYNVMPHDQKLWMLKNISSSIDTNWFRPNFTWLINSFWLIFSCKFYLVFPNTVPCRTPDNTSRLDLAPSRMTCCFLLLRKALIHVDFFFG